MKKNAQLERLKREMQRVSSDPDWGIRYVLNMDVGIDPHLKIKQPIYVVDMDDGNRVICACDGLNAAGLITKALNDYNKQEKWKRTARAFRLESSKAVT